MEGVWQVLKGIFEYFSTHEKVEIISHNPWMQIWSQKCVYIGFFVGLLLLIVFAMVFKDRLSKNRKLLNLVTYGILTAAFVYAGIVLKAQPTMTNIVIILNGLREGAFMLGLFVMEPYIFLSFIFILLTIFLWGRGVFCGWLCPYGAMLELLNRIYTKILPRLRIFVPEKVHWKLIYLKYVVFAVIMGVSFYSFMLSEYFAEVEPFKTFVLRLNRQWYFVLYFLIITAGSTVVYRAYCRYLCPLGAALAIPSFLKVIPLIKLKRHDLCGTCKICSRACDYQAIGADGKVDTRECFDCLECQANFWDEDRCPSLKKKLKEAN